MRIHLAVEHALELELAHAVFEAGGILLDVGGGGFIVLALGEVEELGGIGDRLGSAIQLFELRGELGAFAAELAGLVRVLPDGGVFQLATYLFEAFLLVVVLKETP
jgi:hypothetical protein